MRRPPLPSLRWVKRQSRERAAMRPTLLALTLLASACATTPDTAHTGPPRSTTTSYDLPVVAHDFTPTPPTTVAPVVPMTAAPPVTAEVEPEPEVVPAAASEPVRAAPSDPFSALAACESTGDRDGVEPHNINPSAVNPTGKYRGAFQFDIPTWESVGGTGDPAAHSYAEQLERARLLQARRGWAPWPHCSQMLGLR